MYESLAVVAPATTARAPKRATHRAFRLKVALAAAIPAVGILAQTVHAYAQGCSCG